jgi:hypothetical protein
MMPHCRRSPFHRLQPTALAADGGRRHHGPPRLKRHGRPNSTVMTESDVQGVVARWFADQGYSVRETCVIDGRNNCDLVATSEATEWRVEVKGDYDKNSAQYNVNFDTGMGQLLKSVTHSDGRIRYGIAIPFSRTERRENLSYRRILPKYSHSLAFELLNIHVLLVRDDRTVEVVQPSAVTTLFKGLA